MNGTVNGTLNDSHAPPPESVSQMTLETYEFPAQKLQRQLSEPDKIPLVLVACGSCMSSPPSPLGTTAGWDVVVRRQLLRALGWESASSNR
jgi:hypothetical protein